jgi:hypothetical protein
MNTTENFEKWFRLRNLGVGDLPQCGDCPAVYAFRDSRTHEILKFGETGTLRSRIFANFIGGFGGRGPEATTQRAHRELFSKGMIDHVEIAWIETRNKADAKQMEKQFRQDYRAGHDGRRQIWDRQD